MKTIAVTNQKGGVGKTTTTQHVAAALGERGYRVLAIDLDPQSNLTMAAGVSIDELDHSMYQVLVTRKIELREAIIPTAQGYDLAPADPNLGVADTEMVVGAEPLRWRCWRCTSPRSTPRSGPGTTTAGTTSAPTGSGWCSTG